MNYESDSSGHLLTACYKPGKTKFLDGSKGEKKDSSGGQTEWLWIILITLVK